jgi:hypothetical protein
MKIDQKKSGGDFLSINTFLSKLKCAHLSLLVIFMHAVNLRFCAFSLFGANNLQIRKNDYASRLAEIMEKGAFCRLGTKSLVGLL